MGSETDTPPPTAPPLTGRRVHSRASRWMHWINFPLLAIMIHSGLRIYWANDVYDLSFIGIDWHFFPDGFYETLGLRARLARGIAVHFTMGWFFAINGLAFGVYLAATGSWRRFLPSVDDLKRIPPTLLHELGLRREPPEHSGEYNVVQQLAYATVLFLGALALLSGFAIYKPTQLSPLTAAFGGYDSARAIHFIVTMSFVAFFVIHVLQVARAGPRVFMSMVTGYLAEGGRRPVVEASQRVRSRVPTRPAPTARASSMPGEPDAVEEGGPDR